MNSHCDTSDLLVFSHLNWEQLYKGPRELLSRQTEDRRIFYFQPPVFGMTEFPRLHLKDSTNQVQIITPYIPSELDIHEMNSVMRELIEELIRDEGIRNMTVCYYNPEAIPFTEHLKPEVVIFDFINEIDKKVSHKLEVIFTGGATIKEAMKDQQKNSHSALSSIDYEHFSQGRMSLAEPSDQICIPHPRVGFYGELDKMIDINLLREISNLRPEYQFIIIGLVSQIDESSLPKAENIHYLGKKDYSELPLYLAGWDCAMIPFALSDASHSVSPLKVNEYLAAGKPVVTTKAYGEMNPSKDTKLIFIADGAQSFVEGIEEAMKEKAYDPHWISKVDQYLDSGHWDSTLNSMRSAQEIMSEIKIPVYMDSALIAIGIV